MGAMASAIAYLVFVLAGLNGSPWWRAGNLFGIIVFAPAHVLAAWAIFLACGVLAFAFRRRVEQRLFVVAVGLVGLPTCWAFGLRYFYYDHAVEQWPGFDSESWRWLVSHIYAEYSFGFLIGFLGLAAATLRSAKLQRPH